MMTTAIRWAKRVDFPAIMQIERESFEFPWTEDEFIRCLRQRCNICMVAEWGDEVLGFMVYELCKNRLHILNIAVAQDNRRFGVGEAMVGKLVGKLGSNHRDRIMLEIRETNLDAQLFFRAMGFRAISTLRGFYPESTEDAYLFQIRHSDPVVRRTKESRFSKLTR